MRAFTVLFIGLFFFNFLAQAKITILAVSGVSYFEADTNGNFTIYGGIAGTCASRDGVSTCNSCSNSLTAPATACNQKSVYPNLPILISYKSDQALNNVEVNVSVDAVTTGKQIEVTGTVTSAAEATNTISIPWTKVCENDAVGATCMPALSNATFSPASRKIYVGVDEDADGTVEEAETASIATQFQFISSSESTILPSVNAQDFCTEPTSAIGMCGYKLGVGDSKLYLEEVYGGGASGVSPTQLSSSDPAWFGIAVFALDTSSVLDISSSVNPKILTYNSAFRIDDNVIDGLTNYTNYCVLMGNINKAQNIYKFNYLGSAAGVAANVCGSPSEVVGLLSDKSCFISTAAFGSEMASQVQILREFRNKYLLTNAWGASFVKKYYQYSPELANFIKESNVLKAIVRTLLYPFIGLSWLMINYGVWPLFFVSILILAGFFIFRFPLRKRKMYL
jgi:hypothetical protein